jgi:hypothetical protein
MKSRFALRQKVYMRLAQQSKDNMLHAGEVAWDFLCQQPRHWTFIGIVFSCPLIIG